LKTGFVILVEVQHQKSILDLAQQPVVILKAAKRSEESLCKLMHRITEATHA